MPNMGCLLLSLLSVIAGATFVLFPRSLAKLSTGLNRTVMAVDRTMVQHRYVFCWLLFIVG